MHRFGSASWLDGARPRQRSAGRVLLAALAGWLITAAALAQPPADTEVARAVTDRLIREPGVNAHRIDVAVTDGIVDLTGTIDNILAKERAARVSETVTGVRAVVNRIEIAADERTDEALSTAIETALTKNPATEAFEIDVRADRGEVTLEGTVDSWQERRLAARVAKGVDGVRALTNRLQVRPPETRDDAQIEAEVEQTLRWDGRIDDAGIEVEVEAGEVRLTGTVASAAERRRAAERARVQGVSIVSTEGLQVEGWAREDRFRAGKYQALDPEAVQKAVEEALDYDPRVNSLYVTVRVADGVVTLDGRVPTLEGKRAAAATARNTVGVWRVVNRIRVRAPEVRPDAAIAADVRQILDRDPYLDPQDEVNVAVEDGVVTLTGAISTTFERAQADYAAASVAGVVEVVNRLIVALGSPYVAPNAYVDEDWDLYDFDWYSYPVKSAATVRGDWEIVEDIRDELFWSPFVDSDDIMVTVDDGTATLTGTVGTLDERRAATQNAFEGGALAVDNDLRVVHGPAYYAP